MNVSGLLRIDPRDARPALLIVWGVLSFLAFAVIVASFIAPPSLLLSVPMCELKANSGRECSFCGMTRAFILISSGDFQSATRVNRGSLPLYLSLLLNGIAFIWYISRRRGARLLHVLRIRRSILDRI